MGVYESGRDASRNHDQKETSPMPAEGIVPKFARLLPRLRLPVVFVSLFSILYCAVYLAVWTPNFQFQSTWRPDGVLRVVEPFPGSQVVGLFQANDVITAIDGEPARRLLLRPLFPPGREVYRYTILRGKQQLQITAPAGKMSLDLLRRRLSSVFVALGAWVVGALVILFAAPGNRDAWVIGLTTLGLAVVLAAAEAALYGVPMTWLASDPFLPFLAVCFAQLGFLPRRSPPRPLERWFMSSLYAVSAGLGLLSLVEILFLAPQGLSFELLSGISLSDVILVALGLGLFLNPVILLVRFWRTKPSYLRQQLAILLIGTLLGVLPLVFLSILPDAFQGTPFLTWDLSVLFMLLIPASYGFVILRRRYLHLDIFATQTLLLTALVLVLFGAFAGTSTLLHRLPLFGWLEPFANTVSFSVALGGMALVGPSLRRVAATVVFGRAANYDTHLSHLTALLSASPQYDTLCRVFRHLVDLVQVRQAALFLAKGQQGIDLITSVGVGDVAPLPASLSASPPDHPLLRSTLREGSPWQSFFESYPWAEGIVPLVSHGQLIGAMILGRQMPDVYFNAQDIRFFNQAARAMAVAGEASRLFEAALDMSRELLQIRDQERTQLAMELHNEPLQRLSLIASDLNRQVYENDALDSETRAFLDRCLGELTLVSGQIRGICTGLRPPILSQGVYWAVKEVVYEFKRETGLQVAVEMDREGMESLPLSLTKVVYHVLVEALNNVRKHAKACQIWVELHKEAGCLHLVVADNGVGTSVTELSLDGLVLAHHFGIVGMHEWVTLAGGELKIQAREGGGTVVSAKIPT